jgi:replication factor C large subunit
MNLIDKYKPRNISEVKFQDNVISKVTDFIENYKKQKKKALLVYGPTGIGKTSSIYAIAADLNLELIEVNASDVRNKEQIEKKIGNAMHQRSLFSKGKIILVDEIDGLSGRKDRGGVTTLAKMLKDSTFPVILTAEDPFIRKLSSIKKKSLLVEYKPADVQELKDLLKEICKKEKIKADDTSLMILARRTGGDVRAAITDLQILTYDGVLKKEEIDALDDRKQTESIKKALTKIFKTKNPEIALASFDNINENFDEFFLWLDENISTEYKDIEDIAKAYDALSMADVYRGRIRRWQYWRYLVYMKDLLTAGIALAKKEKYKDINEYKQNSRLLKIWIANAKNAKRKAIAEKWASYTHVSSDKAFKDIFFLKNIFKNKEYAKKITEELELEKEEVDWLKK